MQEITPAQGYQMIVTNRIPKLSIGYLKSKIVDRDVWSNLYLNNSKEQLENYRRQG